VRIFLTGVAGFIGMHVAETLLKRGDTVIGIDNLNNYYDTSLKKARLDSLHVYPDFTFHEIDISNKQALDVIFKKYDPEKVINLAAQAGVRYSLENPDAYISSNIQGFVNILEVCKTYEIQHLVYASSSSVYGSNASTPFTEDQNVDHPISLYGATKKSNELMAHTYSHLFNLPTTGLRFFTVYGPWGRPDMALFLFTKAILNDEEINVFNNGDMVRDFTFISDIVEGVVRVLDKDATRCEKFSTKDPKPDVSNAPYRIFNIGNNNPQKLMKYINTLEDILEKKAKINFMPMQAGDVKYTSADTNRLEKWISFKPNTSIENGVNEFINWYKKFYKIN